METERGKVYIYLPRVVIAIKVQIKALLSGQNHIRYKIANILNKYRFCYISGDYMNNQKEGNGIFWWTTGTHAGDKYEGQFKNDQRFVLEVWFN